MQARAGVVAKNTAKAKAEPGTVVAKAKATAKAKAKDVETAKKLKAAPIEPPEDPEEGCAEEEQAEESDLEEDPVVELEPDYVLPAPQKNPSPFDMAELMTKVTHTARESKFFYAEARRSFEGTNDEWLKSELRALTIKMMPDTEIRRRKFPRNN